MTLGQRRGRLRHRVPHRLAAHRLGQRLGQSRRWRWRWRWRRRVQVGVLALAVPAQVHFPLEGAAALVAGERLVTGVLARVRDQVRRLAERLPANGALVRLLPCCNIVTSALTCVHPSLHHESHRLGCQFSLKLNAKLNLSAGSNLQSPAPSTAHQPTIKQPSTRPSMNLFLRPSLAARGGGVNGAL